MPDERFLHRRLGHSEKVCSLTDFEFRVWTQYQLSADDYGVMRYSPDQVRADNDALAARPVRQVERAIERILVVGLLRAFEHQGRGYVFQTDWQDFQKIRHPRTPIHPCPPPDCLSNCTVATIDLFRSHPGCSSEALSEDFGTTSGILPGLARARGRETANGQRLTANGSEKMTPLRAGFEQFWVAYPRKVGKDAAWREWQRIRPVPDDAFTASAVAAIGQQRSSAQWQRDGGHYIPHPRTWLHQGRWQDEAERAAMPSKSGLTGRIPDQKRQAYEDGVIRR
jgi:hypothetical protein